MGRSLRIMSVSEGDATASSSVSSRPSCSARLRTRRRWAREAPGASSPRSGIQRPTGSALVLGSAAPTSSPPALVTRARRDLASRRARTHVARGRASRDIANAWFTLARHRSSLPTSSDTTPVVGEHAGEPPAEAGLAASAQLSFEQLERPLECPSARATHASDPSACASPLGHPPPRRWPARLSSASSRTRPRRRRRAAV